MGTYVVKDREVFVGSYDLTGNHTQVDLTLSRDLKDATVFKNGSIARKATLKDVACSGSGMWDETPDGLLVPNIGGSQIVTVCCVDGEPGDIAYSFQSIMGECAPLSGKVGDLHPFTYALSGRTASPVRGRVMASGAKTSTADGTAYEIGALAAGYKAFAAMHVVAASGTSPTLDMIIESDDAEGFASGTTRFTFTQATDVTSEWLTPIDGDTSPITDTWWRASWTIGGSDTPTFTVMVVLSIQAA